MMQWYKKLIVLVTLFCAHLAHADAIVVRAANMWYWMLFLNTNKITHCLSRIEKVKVRQKIAICFGMSYYGWQLG